MTGTGRDKTGTCPAVYRDGTGHTPKGCPGCPDQERQKASLADRLVKRFSIGGKCGSFPECFAQKAACPKNKRQENLRPWRCFGQVLQDQSIHRCETGQGKEHARV